MTSNAIIDVGMGLILMYLVLSLVCTIVNEFVAGVVNLRARTLASGIARLIDDPQLRGRFQDHGLVGTAGSASNATPSYLSGRTVALALLGSLDPAKPLPAVADVLAAAGNLPDSNIKDVILTAAASAGGNVDRLRNEMSAWFDDSMDRLSGVYKRYARWISLAVGLALAVGLNADTVAVSSSLWADGTLRAEIVQMADKAVAGKASPDDLAKDINSLASVETQVRPFPIGWTNITGRSDQDWSGSGIGFATKLVGLLITGLALSLGAPFWFDLLVRFVNLRATGAKPEKSGDS